MVVLCLILIKIVMDVDNVGLLFFGELVIDFVFILFVIL